jgi:hypothetical protein
MRGNNEVDLEVIVQGCQSVSAPVRATMTW